MIAPYFHHPWALITTCEAPHSLAKAFMRTEEPALNQVYLAPQWAALVIIQGLNVQQRQHRPQPQSSLTLPRNTCPAISTLFWVQFYPKPSRSAKPHVLLSFDLTKQSRLQPKDLGRLAPGRAVLRVRKNHPTGRDDPSTHPDTPEPKKTWWILMCTTHAVRQNPPVIQTLRTDSFHYFSCGHHLLNWMGSRFGREKTMANPMVIDNWICNCSQRGSWERHINAHIHTLILPTLSISNSIMASLFTLA